MIAPEHLIVTKLLAGRPKDLEDARGLLRRDELRLDIAEVERIIVLLEAAIGRSDLGPLLAELRGRPRRRSPRRR